MELRETMQNIGSSEATQFGSVEKNLCQTIHGGAMRRGRSVTCFWIFWDVLGGESSISYEKLHHGSLGFATLCHATPAHRTPAQPLSLGCAHRLRPRREGDVMFSRPKV